MCTETNKDHKSCLFVTNVEKTSKLKLSYWHMWTRRLRSAFTYPRSMFITYDQWMLLTTSNHRKGRMALTSLHRHMFFVRVSLYIHFLLARHEWLRLKKDIINELCRDVFKKVTEVKVWYHIANNFSENYYIFVCACIVQVTEINVSLVGLAYLFCSGISPIPLEHKACLWNSFQWKMMKDDSRKLYYLNFKRL